MKDYVLTDADLRSVFRAPSRFMYSLPWIYTCRFPIPCFEFPPHYWDILSQLIFVEKIVPSHRDIFVPHVRR